MTIHRNRNRKFYISNRRNNDKVHVCNKKPFLFFSYIDILVAYLFLIYKYTHISIFLSFTPFHFITLHYITFYADMF